MRIASFGVLRELSPGKSWLANDPAGRPVVLKMLPSDCLLEGQLNPNIAERLRRVREIAMTNVANLRGVERDGERAFLVWDYIDGVAFDTYAADVSREAVPLVRELVRTVQHFHSTGLVHGAIQSNNVLVASDGRIKLIDISPLLFLDPERDELAVVEMCRMLANLRHDPALAAAVVQAQESDSPLESIAASLSQTQRNPKPAPPRITIRRRSLLAALVVMLIGVGLAIGIDRMVRRNRPPLLTPPRVSR
jgi:serine/threonine protein kinase